MLPKFFSLTKILSSVSKGLVIAEQIIPLYQKIAPGIDNIQKIIKKIPQPKVIEKKKMTTTKDIDNSHNPTFFV